MDYRAPLEKIEKNESYGLKVYRQLKSLIVSGSILAGTVINEREFSQLLGVSRTPLRDAIRMLEMEGWITEEGSSRIVTFLTWGTIKDLIEIREPFEQMSFQLAMKNATEQDFKELNAIIDRMKPFNEEEDMNFYEAMKTDTDFHRYIGYMSGNKTLIGMQNVMYEKVVRSSVLSMRIGRMDPPSFAAEHRDLIQCLKNQDEEAGRLAVLAHCDAWKKRLTRLPEVLGFSPEQEDYIIPESFIQNEDHDIHFG